MSRCVSHPIRRNRLPFQVHPLGERVGLGDLIGQQLQRLLEGILKRDDAILHLGLQMRYKLFLNVSFGCCSLGDFSHCVDRACPFDKRLGLLHLLGVEQRVQRFWPSGPVKAQVQHREHYIRNPRVYEC